MCLLERWIADELLQAIASENNLSETAFVVPSDDPLRIRWFTPREEVPLCGHATLAAGFALMDLAGARRDRVRFESASGPLHVERGESGSLVVDLPALAIEPVSAPPPALLDGLALHPVEVWSTPDDPNYLAVLESEAEVRTLAPDLPELETLHPHGVAVTAPGEDADFVSRYFAPGYGIPEDPVTGSIHCALAPYWSERIGKNRLSARQLSSRGGRIGTEVRGRRVELRGRAVCFLEGEIHL